MAAMSATKVCLHCGQSRGLDDFPPRRNVCRPCGRARQQAYWQQHQRATHDAEATTPRPCLRCGAVFTPRADSVQECRDCLLVRAGLATAPRASGVQET